MGKASKTKPLISVIIPVYNVEPYLKRCLDSVINQSYKKLEIIVVDDGSTDKSGKICDEYEKKDKRITVIHKENGGLSDARNAGIKKSNGSYITFIDSDDYVANNYVYTLYGSLNEHNSDMSIGGHCVIYEDGRTIERFTNEEYVSKPENILDKLLYDQGIDLSACAKLYKKELFMDISYPIGRLFEDAATTYKLIDSSRKISVISRPIYYYYIRSNSITTNSFSPKKLDLILSTKEMTDYIEKKYPNLHNGCKRRLMYSYLSTITQLSKAKNINHKIEKELLDYIKNNRWAALIDRRTPKRDKLGIISLFWGIGFFKFIWNIYDNNRGKK